MMSMTAHRSAPCSTKSRVRLLRSRASPIVLAWPMDASPGGCSTPPPWHIDAVGGRPYHQGGAESYNASFSAPLVHERVVDERHGPRRRPLQPENHLDARHRRRRQIAGRGGEDARHGGTAHHVGAERMRRLINRPVNLNDIAGGIG